MINGSTEVWAHRGASGYKPENSLASFELAAEMKADGVELDVQLSSDGQLVVIHDETLDRVCRGKASGYVKDYTLEELKKLDVGEGEKIPTLEEVVRLLEPTGLRINVELKTGIFRYEGIEEKVLELLKRYDICDRIWCSSFNHLSVMKMKELCSSMKCGFLLGDVMIDPFSYAAEQRVEALHPAVYHCGQDVDFVKRAHEKNLEVHVWTVNQKDIMTALVKEGAEAVITNYPDLWEK